MIEGEDTQTLLENIDAKDENGKLYVKAYGVGSTPYKHEYVVYKLSEDSALLQIRSYAILSEDPTQFITYHSVCTKEDGHWIFNDYSFFVNTVYY